MLVTSVPLALGILSFQYAAIHSLDKAQHFASPKSCILPPRFLVLFNKFNKHALLQFVVFFSS